MGFFAFYNMSLVLVDYCLKNGYVPCFDLSSFVYRCDQNANDPWASFFEPLEIYEDPYKIEGELEFRVSEHPPLVCLSDPSYTPLFCLWNGFPEDKETREHLNKFSGHVKIRQDIKNEAEAYIKEHFSGKIITGAHLRHTDHWTDPIPYLKDQTSYHPFEAYTKVLKEHKSSDHIYIATDAVKNIHKLRFVKELRDKIIYNDFLRATTEAPIHLDKDYYGYDPIRLGREVLIDVIILSRCDYLVGSISNITLTALFWNPSLPFTNIDRSNGGTADTLV